MVQLLDNVVASIHQHPYVWGAAALYVFSTFVSAMPSPDEKSGKFYKFVFAVGHGVAASLPRAIAVLFPAFASKFPFLSNGNDKEKE